MTAGRGRLDRVAASESFWVPHPGEGLLTVRRAALHAGHLHLRSEGKELLPPLSDPVAQTHFSPVSARTLQRKRKNPLFSQATCSAFQQSCLGPVSCVRGRRETGLETHSSVWKGWGGMKPASLLICHSRCFCPVARGLHFFLCSIT